jgi:hypothetical protein
VSDDRYGYHPFTKAAPADYVREEFQRQADMYLHLANENAKGVELGYDRDGVAWIDARIPRFFEDLNAATQELMRHCVGSYLGQCVIEDVGGAWEWNEKLAGWCIQLTPDAATFPHAKVMKRFDNGPGDSLVSFFDLQRALAKKHGGGGDAPPPKRKPLIPRRGPRRY